VFTFVFSGAAAGLTFTSDNGTQRAPFVAGKSAGKKQKYASVKITGQSACTLNS